MDHLYFVVHTHWDREWYQPFQQMRARLVAMADRMIPLVERGTIPSFHFDGQTIVLDDYLEMRPRAESRLRNLIRAGKIQVGPWYVLADSFLVSGESLIRNLEIGMAIARRFGRPLDLGYLPDQFGHIAQMPQILAGFGFKTAVLWRGVGAEVTRNRFVWEALDGNSVLTVYLPNGYSNGANLPLESVESFIARAELIAKRERDFAAGTPILVMNGTDHAEPDPRLTARINEAREISAMTLETGTLENYVRRIAELPLDGTPLHRGELRSPLRAHMLPGVTSARTWIKQRDFENCRALERYADPLAALANALTRGAVFDAFLEAAWKTEIQNHPHDSICGCSVDQVHTDMRYRFDQAAMLAETAVRRAAASCLDSRKADASELAVFNPSFARTALVSGETEVAAPDSRYAVETSDGRRLPVVTDPARPDRPVNAEMPAAEFKSIVGSLSQPSIFGRTVNRYELTTAPDGRPQVNLFMSRAAFSDIDLEEFRHAIRTLIPDSGSVRIHATSAARCTISFVADDLAQAGFSFYRLVRDDSAAESVKPDTSSIENEFLRLTPTPRGLEIRDLRRNAAMELYFEDDGDRGDEYNFDPVGDGAALTSPVSISATVVENGPVRKRMKLAMQFDVPASLSADRHSRSTNTEKLEIALTATLYEGLDRVDFTADVDNRSRDHRLRAALRTPIVATDAVHDTSFGVLRRPLRSSEQRGIEDVYPTVPHRSFTAIEGAGFSAALISRGILEVEARPEAEGTATTILLTLLRCVGWLSRSDLVTRRGGAGPELETPGAQEQGAHRFEFAVATFSGSHLDGDVLQRVEAYTSPPRVFAGKRAGSSLMLLACNNPRVIFSTARPLARAGSYKVRAYSASPSAETARFTFSPNGRARLVDLAGRPVKRAGVKRARDGAVTLALKPFELVTFEVRVRTPAD